MPTPKPMTDLNWVRLALMPEREASAVETRRTLAGVHFDNGHAVATDACRLHLVECEDFDDLKETRIPRPPEKGDWELVEGKYPDWRFLFTQRKRLPSHVVSPGEQRENLLALAAGLAKANATLPKRDVTSGEGRQFLLTLQTEEGRVHLNPAYALDVLRGSYENCPVFVWADSRHKPVFFQLDQRRRAIVMPVRGHRDEVRDQKWVTVDPDPDLGAHVAFDGFCEAYSVRRHGKLGEAA